MVFSAAIITATNTGVTKPAEPDAQKAFPQVDLQPHLDVHDATDKHNVLTYSFTNAAFIGLAGLVTGLQEAYFEFAKMPPTVTRRTLLQTSTLAGIVGRKTLLGATIGFAFCYTEATLENLRHKDDVYNGIAGGLAAGAVFGLMPPKPMPQPIAWPLAFAAAAATADLVSRGLPHTLQGFRHFGPVLGRESWGDPEPPRPPILDTGAGARPKFGNFWRGA